MDKEGKLKRKKKLQDEQKQLAKASRDYVLGMTVNKIIEKYCVSSEKLYNYLTKSGIQRRGKPRIDLTGERVGKLVVIERNPFRPEYWNCQCDCGNITIVKTDKLKDKRTKSCKCWNQRLKGRAIPSKYWGAIKHGAKSRGLAFEVTEDDLWSKFILQNRRCALTGIELTMSDDSKLHTASLDRIDSDKHYTADNIQWVYKDINKMKWEFSEEKFIEYCRKIVEHHDSKIIPKLLAG